MGVDGMTPICRWPLTCSVWIRFVSGIVALVTVERNVYSKME